MRISVMVSFKGDADSDGNITVSANLMVTELIEENNYYQIARICNPYVRCNESF